MSKLLAVLALAAVSLVAQPSTVKARGSASAPIVMEVYSDYQCPHCKMLYEKTLVPLMANYVDKGKVYLIHHEYPNVALHPHSVEAACWACAAHRVGKYEQAGEVLFRDQDSWAASGNIADSVCSILTADEAKKVRALVKDPAILAEVQKDMEAGRAAHVESTPTVLLSHRLKQYPIPGAVSYDILKRFIDSLLTN